MSFSLSQDELYNFAEIGRGSFGIVYSATLPGYGGVAVKKVKTTTEVYRESARLNGIDHPNILKLIGIAKKGNYIPWLILEYMPMGNLLDYVQTYRGGCPAFGMLKMAHGIATGMDFLHRDWNLVHRDLAARNILVGNNWSVKIGDFGLCVSNYNEYEHYYSDGNGRPWSIRWMPPENLPVTGRKFSRKGDIWSYGVVLFEIWSRGQLPYDDFGNDEDIMDAIICGNNPLDYTSVVARDYITDMMYKCWNYESTDRPNFRMLKSDLEENEPSLLGYSSSYDSYSSSDYY